MANAAMMCLFSSHILVYSFLELVEYIFTIPGVDYFFSERLCQDPLEKFFGCQRQRGKSNENPNVQQFCSNSQALRVINGTCANVSKGNCRGNKTTIDWEQENQPLPKRRRHQLKSISRSSKLEGACTAAEQRQSLVSSDHTNSAHHCDNSQSLKKYTATEVMVAVLAEDEVPSEENIIGPTSDFMATKECTLFSVCHESQTLMKGGKDADRWKVTAIDLILQIDKALGPGAADEELCNGFHISMKRCDFWSLRCGKWLNDKV